MLNSSEIHSLFKETNLYKLSQSVLKEATFNKLPTVLCTVQNYL